MGVEVVNACEETVRQFSAKLEITWTSAEIDETIVASSPNENRVHSVNPFLIKHVVDSKENTPFKYAHCNSGMTLDGSYKCFPGTQEGAAKYTTGWWSDNHSGEDLLFINGDGAVNPTLTVSFVERAINSLKVVGDNKYGEYPVTFTVLVYEKLADVIPIFITAVIDGVGDDWELTKVLPSDSVAVKWFKNFSGNPILSAEKMTLQIQKWSHPSKLAKIVEFYTNVVENYDGDDIISLSLTEESEIANGTLPVGNISCNSLDLSLKNINDKFFVGNTDSPIHTFLKRNRKIKAWIGVKIASGEIEYVLLGTFFSGDWQAEELGVDATTQARDRMELLRRDNFSTSELYENITIYDLAVIVLENAFIQNPELVWNISETLKDYTLRYGWFPNVSYFECLKTLASACMGKVYMDRNDVLQLTTDIV